VKVPTTFLPYKAFKRWHGEGYLSGWARDLGVSVYEGAVVRREGGYEVSGRGANVWTSRDLRQSYERLLNLCRRRRLRTDDTRERKLP